MTSRLGIRLLALALPLALLAPAAAHAEKVVFDDAVGDVVSIVDDQHPDQSAPAPEYAGVDVVRTSVALGANRLRVGVRFRALERDPSQFAIVRVNTPDGPFDITVERLGGRPITSIRRGSRDVDCRGLAAKVDLGADTVTAALPASCVDDPRWVQVGVGAAAFAAVDGHPGEGAIYADDGVRIGEIRDRIALGPRVHRG